MKQINKISYYYNIVLNVISVVIGYFLVYYSLYNDKYSHCYHKLGRVIVDGTLFSILGTLCFLMLPLFFLSISFMMRFLPVLYLPIYLVLSIDGNVIILGQQTTFTFSLLMSVWGFANIYSIVKAYKFYSESKLEISPLFIP